MKMRAFSPAQRSTAIRRLTKRCRAEAAEEKSSMRPVALRCCGAARLERRDLRAEDARAGVALPPDEILDFLRRRVADDGAQQDLTRLVAVEALTRVPDLIEQRLQLLPRQEVLFGTHDGAMLGAGDVVADQ